MATTINTNQERAEFFETLFGTNEGYVCIAVAEAAKTKQKFREKYFKWPLDIDAMMNYVRTSESGHNIWFCAQLLDKPERKKTSVSECYTLWADLDTCHPNLVSPEPSVVLESSEGRYQAFWPLEEPIAGVQAEDLSARIAYAHRDDGADISGWDLTQLLRVPYTFNYKYRTRPQVMLHNERHTFKASEFTDLPPVEGRSVEYYPPPSRTLSIESLLEQHHVQDTGVLMGLIKEPPKENEDWSRQLWKLIMGLYEIGMNRTEVYSVATEAACNKFVRDGKPERLWDDVLRGEANFKAYTQQPLVDIKLPAELQKPPTGWKPGFVEAYVEYASTRTDAPQQYHEAGAFILLSAYLGSSLIIQSTAGVIRTNLWICILGETTKTRKSTALDLVRDMLDDDLELASEEGSPEGMLTAIAARDNKAAVFIRDEVVGLLKGVLRKPYLAGMLEQLTKLYDGRTFKRLLRKETITIRDPVFIMFCAGIREAFMESLDEEHLTSGFIPRMMFVMGEANRTETRRLGNIGTESIAINDTLRRQLDDMRMSYSYWTEIALTQNPTEGEILRRRMPVVASGTQEAWDRWNEFEETLENFADTHDPRTLGPILDRYAKSVLKMAALLAGAAQPQEDGQVQFTLEHVEHAIYYGIRWLPYTLEVVKSLGKDKHERLYDRIVAFIEQHPGALKSEVMRKEHLSARDAREVIETLEQRMQVRMQRVGNGYRLYPYGVE